MNRADRRPMIRLADAPRLHTPRGIGQPCRFGTPCTCGVGGVVDLVVVVSLGAHPAGVRPGSPVAAGQAVSPFPRAFQFAGQERALVAVHVEGLGIRHRVAAELA